MKEEGAKRLPPSSFEITLSQAQPAMMCDDGTIATFNTNTHTENTTKKNSVPAQ